MLGQVLREFLSYRSKPREEAARTPRLLNVGGGNKSIPIPSHYRGWEHLLMDIDRRGNPDIICDARRLASLRSSQFDAVYCSHNLEHYYRHDARKVIEGFHHVLKSDGFAEIRVPDLQSVIARVSETRMDLGDVLYHSPAGPILVLDVLYGLGSEIESSGRDFYAHKNGFTAKLLRDTLQAARFASIHVFELPHVFELRALAFKSQPSSEKLQWLSSSTLGSHS